MEATFDNCNNTDLNNPVQNLLQNANTEFKTEKSNEIFKTTTTTTENPFNDGMNNFVQISDTNNMHTNLNNSGSGELHQQQDLPECEQIYQFGDEMLDLKSHEKRPFDLNVGGEGDMGPESNVDVPDDALMATESSEENLSKSSLSHSKEAFPISDNFNPFDGKNSLTDLETNEFQMQDDTKTCTSPSENLLDTPVDPASLDDVKQMLPTDPIHTNGIHSEENHFVEDIAHDHELPIAKDNKFEDNFTSEFENINKGGDDGFSNFMEINKRNAFNDDVENFHGGFTSSENIASQLVENIKDIEENKTEFLEESNKLNEHMTDILEDDQNLEKEKNLKDLFDENIIESNATDPLSHEFDDQFQDKFDQIENLKEATQTFSEKDPFSENDKVSLELSSPISPALNSDIEDQFDEEKLQKTEVGSVEDILSHENEFVPSMDLNLQVQRTEEPTHPEEAPFNKEQNVQEHEQISEKEEHIVVQELEQNIPYQESVLNETEQISKMCQDQEFLAQHDQLLEDMKNQISEIQEECKPQANEDLEFAEEKQDILQMTEKEIPSFDHTEEKNDIEDNQAPIEEKIVDEFQIVDEEAKISLLNETSVDDKVNEIEVSKEEFPALDAQKVNQPEEQNYNPTAPESCEESEDEWNYMRLKGEGEKEILKEGLTEDLASTIEPPAKEESLSSSSSTIPIPEEENKNLENLENEIIESKESTITSVEESKDSATSVQPSIDILEFSDEHLSITDTEVADMSSQLNPEAKEFVPTTVSPVHFELSNGISPVPIAATRNISADDVVAQSPRKGIFSMEGIQVPSEVEFETEIAHCPSNLQISPEQNDLYQEMNMKEAMHGSEKEEQIFDDIGSIGGSGFDCNMPTDLDNVGMKDSIYIQNTFDDDNTQVDLLNTVQSLPIEISEIKDQSMEIPESDTSIKEIQVDKNGLDISENGDNINEIPTLPPQFNQIAGITETFEKTLQFDESPIQPAIEPEIIKQVETNVESIPPIVEPQIDIPQFIEAIPAAVVLSKSPEPAPIQVEKEIITPIEIAPPAEPSESHLSEIKKEENKIEQVVEKAVTEKAKTAKSSIAKVPDVKKDAKTKASSVTAPKKISSSVSASSTDKPKPQTASKVKTTTTTAAPRPRSVPLASKATTEKKPTTTTSTTTSTAAARPKVDSRSTVSLTATKKIAATTAAGTKPKPDEQTKLGVKPTVSKTGLTAKPPVTTKTSTTSTAPKTRTTTTGTNVTTTKTTSQRVALSAPAKSASTTKSLSPRSTLSSCLRKAEAIKSPTGAAKTAPTKSTTTTGSLQAATRTSSGTKTKSTANGGPKTTSTTSVTAAKRSPLPSKTSPRTGTTTTTANALKKSPIKRPSTTGTIKTTAVTTKISPVNKVVTEENKKNEEMNEVKMNGTAIIETNQ